MKTGTVAGVEALIRWQHPTRGLLHPIDFLPAIENNAMSIELGEW
ncbi:EAL domain-containing protein [Shewanella benthica]|uniref:Sensory box/GGDEF/GAF/EAL domain protein n=2 Tax=Shewanella TaxID=22 RepID=A9DHE2_9GAMM|nr:sensory box/GGDEF/GAF/EAL domain protein [Shewanella benthica KT99]